MPCQRRYATHTLAVATNQIPLARFPACFADIQSINLQVFSLAPPPSAFYARCCLLLSTIFASLKKDDAGQVSGALVRKPRDGC